MEIPIKRAIERVPGGLMVVPLLCGALIATFAPVTGQFFAREFLSRAIPVLIPFFAFALGANLDLAKVWQAGLLGLGPGLAVVVGTAVYADAAAYATILVAACVVVTAIVVPLVTACTARRAG